MNRNYKSQSRVGSISSSSEKQKTEQSLRKKRILELGLFDEKPPADDGDDSKSQDKSISSTSGLQNSQSKIDSSASQNVSSSKEFFNVVYGKKSTKKHKTWNGDGTIEVVNNQNIVLKDSDGKVIGRTSVKTGPVTEGFSFSASNYLVEVTEKISSYEIQQTSKPEKDSDYAEPPAKKFKQQFIPLKPSTPANNVVRYNKLSVIKEKNPSKSEVPSTLNPADSSNKPNEKIKKILHLFDKNKNDDCNSSQTEVFKSPANNVEKNLQPTDEQKLPQKITYNVVYGKKTAKKHKTFDEDGLLEVEDKTAVLKDLKGNVIGRSSIKPESIFEGAKMSVGSKEVEVLDKVTSEDLEVKPKAAPHFVVSKILKKSNNQYIPLKTTGKLSTYEPLIMPAIKKEIEWDGHDSESCEVSVDACLASVLRPHQRAGISFLYKCVMGMNKENCEGAILADEMGLGKTLQCITLIWTLLKQGPFRKPVLRRVLIITPSSLCGNWKKEFIRWLGSHRISPYVVNEKNKPKNFASFPRACVMIISYEMFVRNFDDVNKYNFDMVVCDEGHRLKNSEVKAMKMLNQLSTRKRILLTGTPVQNDLQELYTLADFVNPGIFEDRAKFKRHYENPIKASQLPEADEEIVDHGTERAKELHECTKLFTLRRTNDLINKFLPQKHELVIFCRLTKVQEVVYRVLTGDWLNRTVIPSSGMSFPLSVINNLKKICNHPSLIKNEPELMESELVKQTMRNLSSDLCEQSGKLIVLRSFLRSLKETNEKIVLVSYFTKTLDILETVCTRESFRCCRLDGTTSTNSRMQIVERFNSSANNDCRVFLLSAKAGGVGLNLPAASRLILFDSDWNPANDAQAMARIWREGQKRTTYIYRFLTTGSIEEKIYQRQISKTGLSEAVVDSNHFSSMKLSPSELKDLFTLAEDTNSLTHDLMQCSCDTDFDEFKENDEETFDSDEFSRSCQLSLQESNSQHLTINQLLHWQHFKPPIDDELLKDLLLQQASNQITFVFKNSSQQDIKE